MIRCLELAEAGHPCETDTVVNDPKQLLIGVTLHSLTGKVRRTRVHPLSRWRVGAAVNAVAYSAIEAVASKSCLNAGPGVERGGGNPAATGQVNDRMFNDVRYPNLQRGRFL